MVCKSSDIFTFEITENLVPYLRAYIVIVATFNTTGSLILLWGLKRTRQTNTISLQFVIMMSISDLVSSISNTIVLTVMTLKGYSMNCWVTWARILVYFLLGTLNMFSFLMIVLIALDRYLHMRYLERYPSIVTKRRGHLSALVTVFVASTAAGILAMPMPERETAIIQAIYVASVCPFLLLIFMLYRGAMRALRAKSNHLTQSIIIQTKSLSIAAKWVTICVTALTVPLITLQAMELTDEYKKLMNSSTINSMKFFAYTTQTLNGFCSSIIFISQNRPIRILLKRVNRFSHISRRSVVWPIESNAQNTRIVQRVHFIEKSNSNSHFVKLLHVDVVKYGTI